MSAYRAALGIIVLVAMTLTASAVEVGRNQHRYQIELELPDGAQFRSEGVDRKFDIGLVSGNFRLIQDSYQDCTALVEERRRNRAKDGFDEVVTKRVSTSDCAIKLKNGTTAELASSFYIYLHLCDCFASLHFYYPEGANDEYQSIVQPILDRLRANNSRYVQQQLPQPKSVNSSGSASKECDETVANFERYLDGTDDVLKAIDQFKADCPNHSKDVGFEMSRFALERATVAGPPSSADRKVSGSSQADGEATEDENVYPSPSPSQTTETCDQPKSYLDRAGGDIGKARSLFERECPSGNVAALLKLAFGGDYAPGNAEPSLRERLKQMQSKNPHGAYAVGTREGSVGFVFAAAYNARTRTEAENAAKDDCRANGGVNCYVAYHWEGSGQCAWLADGVIKDLWAGCSDPCGGYGIADTETEAVSKCEDYITLGGRRSNTCSENADKVCND